MTCRTLTTTILTGQTRSVSQDAVKCHFELPSLASQAYLQVCTFSRVPTYCDSFEVTVISLIGEVALCKVSYKWTLASCYRKSNTCENQLIYCRCSGC